MSTKTARPAHPVGGVVRADEFYAFSSFFSSFKNRQSVPCAISLFGSLLIIPLSWSRTPKNRRLSSTLYVRQRLYERDLTTSKATSYFGSYP